MLKGERSSCVNKSWTSKSMRSTRPSISLLTRIPLSWFSKDLREIWLKFIAITSSQTNLWSKRTKHLKLWYKWVSQLKVTKVTKIYGKRFGLNSLRKVKVTRLWFLVWKSLCAQFRTCRWTGCTSLKSRVNLSSLKRSNQFYSQRIWG